MEFINNSFQSETKKISVRSLEDLKTPRSLRPVAVAALLLVSVVIAGLAFVPWQQSVTGNGKVVIFSPMDRMQNVESQIPARIVKLNVQEGEFVKADQIIAELEDIDSKFLSKSQIARLQAQMQAQNARLKAAQNREAALTAQIESVSRSRQIQIPTAQERFAQNADRVRAAEQSRRAAQQTFETSELNFARIRELHEKGLRSKRDLELAELELVRSKTETERAAAALEVARRDNSIGDFDRQRVDADTAANINSLQASLASVRETIAVVENDKLKLQVELENVTERGAQNVVRAPRDGQIVRMAKVGAGATVKAGDVLAILAPRTTEQTVEIFLSDNDAPLVAVGRAVRLQFAGFPALQFTGMPQLAVGTFAGRVAVIDPVDDGKNRFRVIVVPDKEAIDAGREPAWLPNTILRPGTETVGWVLLDTVPLGFELWRQFNAFPPTVPLESLDKGKEKGDDKQMLDEKFDLKDVLKK